MTQEQGKTGAVRRYAVSPAYGIPAHVVDAADYDAALSRAETAEKGRDEERTVATAAVADLMAAEKQRDELAAALAMWKDTHGMVSGEDGPISCPCEACEARDSALASIAKEQQT